MVNELANVGSVVYWCAKVKGSHVIDAYGKVYRRYGDAAKRRDIMNTLNEDPAHPFKVFGAKGWFEVD